LLATARRAILIRARSIDQATGGMSEAVEHEVNEDLVYAKAIGRSVIAGLPVSFVVITLGVWQVTGQPFATAFVASILPSVLMGVFGGGFVGTILGLARTNH
jgi:hypothetical protein